MMGGRTKIRSNLREAAPEPEKHSESGLVISHTPGRSKPVAKQSFDAEWREPKLEIEQLQTELNYLQKHGDA
jgi:hypothetical protein